MSLTAPPVVATFNDVLLNPLPNSIGELLPAAMGPWMTDDLADLCAVIALMWAPYEIYYLDDPDGDGNDGWSVFLDVDLCPTEALPSLAQWIGERLPTGLTDAASRQWIRDAPNSKRGTPESIARAAQRTLTGSQIVQILERTLPNGGPDPNGDNFIVYTYASQTPNAGVVWMNLLDVIPADMVCTYQAIAGATWAGVQASHPTWAQIKTEYGTWAGVQGAVTGSSVWTAD
jgi:hypothetical protein